MAPSPSYHHISTGRSRWWRRSAPWRIVCGYLLRQESTMSSMSCSSRSIMVRHLQPWAPCRQSRMVVHCRCLPRYSEQCPAGTRGICWFSGKGATLQRLLGNLSRSSRSVTLIWQEVPAQEQGTSVHNRLGAWFGYFRFVRLKSRRFVRIGSLYSAREESPGK